MNKQKATLTKPEKNISNWFSKTFFIKEASIFFMYIGVKVTDDHLDALHEAAVTDKKSLCEFHPMAQSTYSAL